MNNPVLSKKILKLKKNGGGRKEDQTGKTVKLQKKTLAKKRPGDGQG